AALDFVAVVARVVPERVELLLGDELGREELVDEGDVVVERADLEDLLAAEPGAPVPVAARLEAVALLPLLAELPLVPALLDVPEELDADLVGVQPARAGLEDGGAPLGVLDDLSVVADLLGHRLRVP